MAAGKIVEDSGFSTQSLPYYFIDHNLSIAKQCLSSVLSILAEEIGKSEIESGLNYSGNAVLEGNLECANNASVELLKKILVLVDELEISLDIVGLLDDRGYSVLRPARIDSDINFRHVLVDLMVLTLQCWEQTTGKDKIELAEKSKLWRVTNDNSQLRVRTMDRYFSIKKLPKAPRWQAVLDTAYFVLNQGPRDTRVMKQLEQAVNNMVIVLRSRALL